MRDAPVRDVPLLGTQRADELFVVGDHDDAAFVVADRDGEAAKGVAVEVVGGFVEDEEVRVIPHGAREDDFDFLAAGETGDFVVVGDVRVEADVFEVLGDDFGREFTEAEAFARGFVVVEFLDEFVEAEVHEGFAGDLGVVFWEHVDPFSGRVSVTGCQSGEQRGARMVEEGWRKLTLRTGRISSIFAGPSGFLSFDHPFHLQDRYTSPFESCLPG